MRNTDDAFVELFNSYLVYISSAKDMKFQMEMLEQLWMEGKTVKYQLVFRITSVFRTLENYILEYWNSFRYNVTATISNFLRTHGEQ